MAREQYILKLFDNDLITFTADSQKSDPGIEIMGINERDRRLLPLGLEPTPRGLERWIARRVIPKNRAYAGVFLAKSGLSVNRPMAIAKASHALSLNDSYWIAEQSFDKSFEQVNFYENPISRVLGEIAFTGYGSSVRSTFASSPEFTTNGMLPKCWRRSSGVVSLWKGGSDGASNTGFEPYSEFYAAQVAEALEIDAVSYRLGTWRKSLCSVCEIFTSKDLSFVPMGRIVREGGLPAVEEYYRQLGPEFTEALGDMFVLDAVICNTDRHYGNFGILVDSHTNEVVAPAPLFDHGNSLFSLAGLDDFESLEILESYAATQLPRVYDDFFEQAAPYLNADRKRRLRKLISFKFRKSPVKNLPAKRLDTINQAVVRRALKLLG